MAKSDITRKGKHLAFLLRHDKEAFEDGRTDKHGWRQVNELAKLGYARSLLNKIVAHSEGDAEVFCDVKERHQEGP